MVQWYKRRCRVVKRALGLEWKPSALKVSCGQNLAVGFGAIPYSPQTVSSPTCTLLFHNILLTKFTAQARELIFVQSPQRWVLGWMGKLTSHYVSPSYLHVEPLLSSGAAATITSAAAGATTIANSNLGPGPGPSHLLGTSRCHRLPQVLSCPPGLLLGEHAACHPVPTMLGGLRLHASAWPLAYLLWSCACSIGLHVQNTSSKIKWLWISR